MEIGLDLISSVSSLTQVINMAVKSKEFYDLAETLYQKNTTSDEICCRSSINRAYYGAFHATKVYLKLTDKDETSHSAVIRMLTRKKYNLGTLLGDLFSVRKDADYKKDLSFNQDDVKKVLKIADTIIRNL